MGKLKGQAHKVLADNLIEFTLPPFTIVQDGFVDHIPAFYTAFIARQHGMYMFAHPFDKHFFGYLFAFLILKKPTRCLGMPDQCMTNQAHPVFFAVFNKTIRIFEVKFPFPWL
ncbi:hypothetical protein D3C73_1430250 [compost metagenome]